MILFGSAFSLINKRKVVIIVFAVSLVSNNIISQPQSDRALRNKILSIYNSSEEKTGEKLKELLEQQKEMKALHLETDSSYMMLLQKIGVLYFKQADYSRAINFTKESISTAKKVLQNELALVQNYSNLYYYYDSVDQQKNKYNAIDSCIEYAFKCGAGFDMIIGPLYDKTEYFLNKGEYNSCTWYAKLGENITIKYSHGKDSIKGIVSFVITQADALYLSKNRLATENLLQNRIIQFIQTGNSKFLGPFYSLLGLINRDNQDYVKALICLQEGFRLNTAIGDKKGCVQDLATIGTLYAKNLNENEKGLDYCKKALRIADSNDSQFIFKQIANIYVLMGMYESAQYFFQQSYNTIQQGMNEDVLLQNTFQFPSFNLLQNLSDLTTDKGDAFVYEYNVKKNKNLLLKALSIYKKNDLFLAKIKTEQQLDLFSNLVWRTTARNLYEHAIDASFAGNRIEEAFYFFEKSRAVLLNDQINEQRWMADTDIAEQAVLKKAIVELNSKLNATAPASNEYLNLQKTLYLKNQQFDVLSNAIKNKNPLYYKNYLDTSFISLSQLRKDILTDSKSLLEIFCGDSTVYVLTVTNNNQSLTKLNKHLYDSLVNSFTSFIANRYVLNEHFKDFITISHQLYHLLFQNFQSSSGSIIISPDGVNYPFEALVINTDNNNPDYFLNHHATSYTYSVKYLTNQFTVNTTNSNSVLGIAPIQFKNNQDLADLSGSDNSLKTINSFFGNATNFVLEKATRNNFLQNFPGYNIIQLYTHASDTSSNGDPVIYFSDSALYLSSLIPDRKPVTQLVVLSACETANGKLYRGEGIFSFNRGFAALGIPAAISNLWSVDNESTYRVTELFYKYLSQGLPTDVALQKAKLEFINNSSSQEKKLPYFWAGSILTGKVDVIKSGHSSPWIKFLIITIFVLAFFYFISEVLRSRS